ncbi:hypothetical protein SAMN05892883_0661 [Jatrophihabitans sp. GAS493]|uniref:DUF1684 domain-containing protein n=1 Tax=Jatrophihabitans sp. GAS493 TaxID=1907575 RepID=UPI000BB85237|nr:DUF1684 domain-containing protein [Jatrophihabitans sp. GAS493]SOD71067.1 hypothetical protein SAMN05892883_0661 [Jatrophihabitans sp. GAS493]
MPKLWTDDADDTDGVDDQAAGDAQRTVTGRLQLADWRRRVARLYAQVRAEEDPAAGHALWRAGRDELFREHPQSPLLPDSELFTTGLPYWPYDPRLRFEVPLLPTSEPLTLQVPTASDGLIPLRRIGQVQLPAPLDASLDVWWLQQYAGGIFLPLRDGSSGRTSYGGGRYLLDTAKSADLGGSAETLVLDLNFLYHPSCRYNPAWECPLAQPGNTIGFDVQAGERLTA